MSKIYDELKRAEDSQHLDHIISGGLRINGEISGKGGLLVEGIVEGPIHLAEGMLTVGAAGNITANIVADKVIIYGAVKGNVTAKDRVEIKNKGVLVGDLKTARIIVEDGANLKGSIEIISQGSTPFVDPATASSTENRLASGAAG